MFLTQFFLQNPNVGKILSNRKRWVRFNHLPVLPERRSGAAKGDFSDLPERRSGSMFFYADPLICPAFSHFFSFHCF
jgi:hypothetical protein